MECTHSPKCLITKIDNRAIIPSKAHKSDSGYDLTIIDVHKQINETTTMYRTGIKIKVQEGYYTEILPRSSIVKSGYILSNSVGIIDNMYTGELFVVLTKVDKNSPDLQLPFKGFQLIFRKQQEVFFEVIDEDQYTKITSHSERSDGGFGSTN